MVYFIQDPKSGCVKIGRSKDPQKRLTELQVGNPNRLVILATISDEHDDAPYHDKFYAYWISGEWFASKPKLMAFISGLPGTAIGIACQRKPEIQREPPRPPSEPELQPCQDYVPCWEPAREEPARDTAGRFIAAPRRTNITGDQSC